jgi:GAF domain-containing protein
VLSVISRSTFDLAKVLNTVLELGARLSKADKGVILRAGGNASYYAAATYRHTPDFIESQKRILFAPGRNGVVGRVLLEGKSVQIADVFDDPEYAYREFARRGAFRTILGVPLVREGSPIGLFVLHRAAVRPFTYKQIELVENFAAQAVIAIENARLLSELHERTNQLARISHTILA